MKFADRVRISSLLSFSLLVFVAALLVWASGELNEAGENDMLADDIQTAIFQCATLRDEYFLHGAERARVQWFGLNAHIEQLLKEGGGRFEGEKALRVFGRVQGAFADSLLASRRLVQQLQGIESEEWEAAHRDEFATLLYSQVMLKDSALQQAAAALQKMARERFNTANSRALWLTLLFVCVMVAGTIANSSFINSLLRRRLAMLNNGAAVISSGDFGYRMPVEGNDELAELGRVINSVTEKVQHYTRQLQDKHDLLNDLSSQVPGILFQARLSPEGDFSTPYVSRGANDIYQVEPGEIVKSPTSLFGAIGHADEQGILASFLRSARTLRPWEHEYRITVPGGATKWLRGQARPIELEEGGTLWHGFISDVTERKMMEEALSESEARFRMQLQELTNIYTHTPVGLFAVDRDLRFLRLNERLAEINGKTIEEHLGRTVDEVLPSDLAARLRDTWWPVLERGECVLNVELQVSTWSSTESRRYWLASYQPLLSETGAVSGLMGFVLDITERKLAEQVMAGARQSLEQKVLQRTARLSLANEHLTQEIEVRKKVEEELLAQQQKLQEMALDLSMAEERERDRIAGELHDQVGQRLILAKIKLDTLASHLPPGDLDAEAGGIGTLIEQTLQDIRSLTFQIRPPLLASAGLEAALRWLGEELRADFGLEVCFGDDNAEKPLRYDVRSTVFQAVRELLLNVAKHAGTKRCQVDFLRAGDSIVISVADDGIGLKTGPPEGSGTRSGGFGLSNLKQRIEYLGGDFVIESKAAGGTRAVIKVPLEAPG